MDNIEQELKIALTEEDYKTLLGEANVSPLLQSNYYFYCDNMPLDTLVRIREKNGRYSFCCKKLLYYVDGVNVCDERETPLDEATALGLLNNGIPPKFFKDTVGLDTAYVYRCAGNLKTYRARFVLDKWIIELDKNEYLDVVDYELECECASLELLAKLKDYLLYNYGINFKPSLSKSARFFKKLKNE